MACAAWPLLGGAELCLRRRRPRLRNRSGGAARRRQALPARVTIRLRLCRFRAVAALGSDAFCCGLACGLGATGLRDISAARIRRRVGRVLARGTALAVPGEDCGPVESA